AISSDGSTVVFTSASGRDFTIKRLDRQTEVAWPTGHGTAVKRIALSPDGRTLASVGEDLTLRIATIESRKLIRVVERPSGDDVPGKMWFSPDGTRLFTVAAPHAISIRVWGAADGNSRGGSESIPADPDARLIAVSMNARLYATRLDFSVDVVDAKTGASIVGLVGNTGAISALSLSPDGKFAASANPYFSAQLRVWNVATNRQIWSTPLGALSLAFAPDGLMLAAKDGQGHLKFFETTRAAKCIRWKTPGARLARSHSRRVANASPRSCAPNSCSGTYATVIAFGRRICRTLASSTWRSHLTNLRSYCSAPSGYQLTSARLVGIGDSEVPDSSGLARFSAGSEGANSGYKCAPAAMVRSDAGLDAMR
ncbi:MAG TPA: hypothetical protein VHX65_07450, partial [Pirellulales bacterium]|nr:hypothetical protein [Pirellulales bacterium]